MKMRFWQKIYIFTLILFLVSLNAGILSLAFFTYSKTVESMEATAIGEQNYIAMSFERDYEDVGGTNASLLMMTYANHYKDKGMFFSLKKDGETLYSSFPNEPEIKSETLRHEKIGGVRYVVIASTICEGEYVFTFAKNVESLESEFKTLMVTYSLTSLAISLALACSLFFILKRLSIPLERLRETTERIESGDFSVTADESGNDELTLLAKSFNSMIAKINDQMESLELDNERKQMLVDNMAHELRTPLTSIRGYAEYLEKAKTDEETRLIASKYIVSESIRLQKISEILLDGAYIRENPPKMKPVSLSEVLKSTVVSLTPRAKEKGAELTCNADETIVHGEETLLSMLFYNLTENALKACEKGGIVTLSCVGKTVIVTDNGKGMTPEQLTHITEPFYKADKSRVRAEGGAGLGLSLCKQIAELHKIEMNITSEYGKGTKIFLDFTT